jgi:hypothetical protein
MGIVRRTIQEFDRRLKRAAGAGGIVILAGLAGWGGSTFPPGAADTTSAAASNSTAEARQTASPATSALTPTSATTTKRTVSPPPAPSEAAVSSPGPARHEGATPQISSVPLAPANLDGADIAFVSPSRDSLSSGQWYYRIGLLGFPADTVVEISGFDTYGNAQVAPLVMTTAEGSSNPFTTGFSTHFAYGGTCDAAQPATVTVRGKGFSVTETAPRPIECDGGTTPNTPWTPPTYPTPVATSPPSSGAG